MTGKNSSFNLKQKYSSKDLAIIVPTRDRPRQVKLLLDSICDLNCRVGRIIVVASGEDVKEIVMSFIDRIPVEYYFDEPGQIKQRNKGISVLDSSTKLVATIDDDVYFTETAVSEIIKFWNSVEPETAGVGFNIVNIPSHNYNWLMGKFGINVPEPGKVLKSGLNTSITNVKKNFRSEWLNGGGTVWRQKILKEFPHKEIYSKWAVGEDLIFSYPIGKIHPLYVCASAKIRTEDIRLIKESPIKSRYRGRTKFLWGLFFIQQNYQLSMYSFFLRMFAEIFANFIKGILNRDTRRIYNGLGMISGFLISLNCIFKKKNIIEIIEKKT